MSSIQKFFMAILPPGWAASMEKESRSWLVRCPCGNTTSIWDPGGIRWSAAGLPKALPVVSAMWEILVAHGGP